MTSARPRVGLRCRIRSLFVPDEELGDAPPSRLLLLLMLAGWLDAFMDRDLVVTNSQR